MKTVMIVNDKTNMIQEIKTTLKNQELDIITVDNNKKAIEIMEKEEEFGLILIDTNLPDTKKPALFSIKPGSRMNIDTTKEEDFLQKPFTKEELLNFIKQKL
jgi:DNA-binding NtrC family response regulator